MEQDQEEALLSSEQADENVRIPIKDDKDIGLPEHREFNQEEMEHFRGMLEAILFASTEPLTVSMLARKCNIDKVNTRILADSLVDDYAERNGGVLLVEVAGGYQFLTADRYGKAVQAALGAEKKERLTKSALETLSIISYRQPVTLPEIEEIRGANSRSMVSFLLSKKLIKPQGYRPVPGRPTLYVTTKNFLSYFALNSLSDLPTLEDVKELRFDEID